MYIYIIIALAVLFIAWIAYGYFGSRVELLSYTVVDSSKEYEIRQVDQHLIAETEVEGDWDAGINEAFGILAGYIFGENKSRDKIAMTAPVVKTEPEKIAMTAPVIFEDSAEELKAFSFVLPAKYTMENVPEPLDDRVTIRQVEPKKMAVLEFSGFLTSDKFEKKTEELKSYLERDGIRYYKTYSAGYNPPWTPPFMQRLEVWAEID